MFLLMYHFSAFSDNLLDLDLGDYIWEEYE